MSLRTCLTLAATVALGACNVLDTSPPDKVATGDAITTPLGARTALNGAYNELQDGYYYGGTMTHWGDLYADNTTETGTFTSYKSAARRDLFADNGDVTGMWNHIYDAIKRANTLIQKVPSIEGFEDGEGEQILAEAYFLRALNYHNLVKHYGGVPLRLEPLEDANEAGDIVRATVDEVYTQIEADLTEAENLMVNTTSPTNHASLGAVYALQARVASFRGNNALVISKANQVELLGYDLADDFADLFNNDAAETVENIFSLTFTAQIDQQNLFGPYYLSDDIGDAGGRYEMGPSQILLNAFDTTSSDTRFLWSITRDPTDGGYNEGTQNGGAYISKFPSARGDEDFPVLRFAEVLLTKADAFARQNQLDSAVATVNRIRVRANLAPRALGGTFVGQDSVLAEISKQRQIELAAEGDRFTDLVRTGRAQTLLSIDANHLIWPIPRAEIDVAPGVVQNPGY